MDDSWQRPVFIPSITYADPPAAVAWLAAAFGFELTMAITAEDPSGGHWEMGFEGGVIMIGGVWSDQVKTPMSAGGNTQGVHVHLKGGLDAHCERARLAGAVIVREPAEEFYGDRVYAALDPEGHRWTFGQTARFVSREEAQTASGLKIEGWVDPPRSGA